jgi:hypothetical protein
VILQKGDEIGSDSNVNCVSFPETQFVGPYEGPLFHYSRMFIGSYRVAYVVSNFSAGKPLTLATCMLNQKYDPTLGWIGQGG